MASSFLEVSSGLDAKEIAKLNKKIIEKRTPLEIRETAAGNVFVDGLTQCPLGSLKEIWDVLESGMAIRETSENYIHN